jgi:flagella basal body P-ring formation protein FlgA
VERIMTAFNVKHVLIPILALAIFMVLPTTAAAVPDLKADVSNQVVVAGEKVFFKDVARITGPDCALKQDLADVYITKAPEPGRSSTIRLAYLEHRLVAAGIPLDQVEWLVPAAITVQRAAQEIDPGWVRAVVEEYLSQTEPYKSGNFQLMNLRTSTLPLLPTGELGYNILPQAMISPTQLGLTLYVTVDGVEEARLRVSGQVDLVVKAVVAAKHLEKDHRIEAGDLRLARVNLSHLPNGSITNLEQAQGMALRRRMTPGQPVLARDLSKVDVINRGDMVTILAVTGTLKVTSRGVARQGGAVGETITVVNSRSQKSVLATVIAPNTVQVHF